jgi:hypothetical protein
VGSASPAPCSAIAPSAAVAYAAAGTREATSVDPMTIPSVHSVMSTP